MPSKPQNAKATQTVRKLVTGDTQQGVRKTVQSKLGQSHNIRLFDRLIFTWGVVTFSLTQFVLVYNPAFFWIWYTLSYPTLFAVRDFFFIFCFLFPFELSTILSTTVCYMSVVSPFPSSILN